MWLVLATAAVIILFQALFFVTLKIYKKNRNIRGADTADTRRLTYVHRANLRKLFRGLKSESENLAVIYTLRQRLVFKAFLLFDL